MTDSTLLDMLNAARALHDRNPNDPRDCTTCIDSLGNGIPWPCATATALGATGRTEWATPVRPTNIRRTPPTCGVAQLANADFTDAADWPCVRRIGHSGDHEDRDGDTWS